jgi:hypothetical protein
MLVENRRRWGLRGFRVFVSSFRGQTASSPALVRGYLLGLAVDLLLKVGGAVWGVALSFDISESVLNPGPHVINSGVHLLQSSMVLIGPLLSRLRSCALLMLLEMLLAPS